jgi:hypothetical protein
MSPDECRLCLLERATNKLGLTGDLLDEIKVLKPSTLNPHS